LGFFAESQRQKNTSKEKENELNAPPTPLTLDTLGSKHDKTNCHTTALKTALLQYMACQQVTDMPSLLALLNIVKTMFILQNTNSLFKK